LYQGNPSPKSAAGGAGGIVDNRLFPDVPAVRVAELRFVRPDVLVEAVGREGPGMDWSGFGGSNGAPNNIASWST